MARVGSVPCPTPGCTNQDASITRNKQGTLAFKCHRCEVSGFAVAGTKAHRLFEAAMKPDDDAPASPAPPPTKKTKAAPAPEPAPAPPAKRAGFSMENL